MEFKKKKCSGNSVIMKYEVTNISRIFSRGVIKTNFDFIHKDTSGSNYQPVLLLRIMSSIFDAGQ